MRMKITREQDGEYRWYVERNLTGYGAGKQWRQVAIASSQRQWQVDASKPFTSFCQEFEGETGIKLQIGEERIFNVKVT